MLRCHVTAQIKRELPLIGPLVPIGRSARVASVASHLVRLARGGFGVGLLGVPAIRVIAIVARIVEARTVDVVPHVRVLDIVFDIALSFRRVGTLRVRRSSQPEGQEGDGQGER